MALPRRNEFLIIGLGPWFGLRPFHEESDPTIFLGAGIWAEPEPGVQPSRMKQLTARQSRRREANSGGKAVAKSFREIRD
jgi:hypothetical protein